MITALAIASIMVRRAEPLSELKRCFETYPQILVNLKVREKKEVASIPSIDSAIKAVESALGDRGRVLVRYSGTETLARVMVEGEDAEAVESHAQAIAAAIQESLGIPG